MHTWYVRKSTSKVWHAVSLPIINERLERLTGTPPNVTGKSICGLVVGPYDMWSWSSDYTGGTPMPLCGHCAKGAA